METEEKIFQILEEKFDLKNLIEIMVHDGDGNGSIDIYVGENNPEDVLVRRDNFFAGATMSGYTLVFSFPSGWGYTGWDRFYFDDLSNKELRQFIRKKLYLGIVEAITGDESYRHIQDEDLPDYVTTA